MVISTNPVPLQTGDDGVIRVLGTRVTLDTVVGAFHRGESAETIVDQYPTLQIADAYAVIAWYLRNQTEVEDYLGSRRESAEAVRRENEIRCPPESIRARLLERQRRRESSAGS